MFLDFLFSIIVFVGLTFLVFLLIDYCFNLYLKRSKILDEINKETTEEVK